MQYETITLAEPPSHHLIDGEPLYQQKFLKVDKFHKPGLAPAIDQSGAFHINLDGLPAYPQRYLKSFGFYESRAAVKDEQGFFHINDKGDEIYPERYQWCGNFQGNACVVMDSNGDYFHINLNGKALYNSRFNYVGDFRDGYAVASDNTNCYHITKEGKPLYSFRFKELDVFHKGIARAKDDCGWFHIDKQGNALYPDRYKNIDNFYNEVAHVETYSGAKYIISLDNKRLQTIHAENTNFLSEVSHDLISFWKTQTLAFALNLNLFSFLPNGITRLHTQINLPLDSCLTILQALWEMDYVKPNDTQESWQVTEKGNYLKQLNAEEQRALAYTWAEHHYETWRQQSISKKIFTQKSNSDHYFSDLSMNKAASHNYQSALCLYSKADYPFIKKAIDWTQHEIALNAGGGYGAWMRDLLDQNPHLQGIVLDLKGVIESIPSDFKHQRCRYIGSDFFKSWPRQADAIILSRVLHDWPDIKAFGILNQAKQALKSKGKIYILEFIRPDNSSLGSLLNLNMHIMANGKERTLKEWKILFNNVHLTIECITKSDNLMSLITVS